MERPLCVIRSWEPIRRVRASSRRIRSPLLNPIVMRWHRSRARSTLLIVTTILLTIVSGCTASARPSAEIRTFHMTFPAEMSGPLSIAALPVALVDHTGLVAGLRQALLSPNDSGATGVTGRPGDPTTLVVSWTGGACDDRVSMNLDGPQTAPQLSIETSSRDGCRLDGIGRSVALDLTVAVSPEAVSLTTH
jgi:hypothetical protein